MIMNATANRANRQAGLERRECGVDGQRGRVEGIALESVVFGARSGVHNTIYKGDGHDAA